MAAHPGALVLTVTAGRPGPHPLTDWDRRCGFEQDDDVIGARRREDEEAVALLGARPVWFDFLDRQYGPSPAQSDLVEALEPAIAGAGLVASPLGLFHEDHVMTAAACFAIARAKPETSWLVYEDAIYRPVAGRTDAALAALREDCGFVLTELEVGEAANKKAAVACYTSQLRGLGDLLADAYRPERYWSLAVG